MLQGVVGAYWHARLLTLGQFRDFVRELIVRLRGVHDCFHELHWVGNGKRAPVVLANDLGNLDGLVQRYSGAGKKDLIGATTADGLPAWSATSAIGYTMVFNTGRSSQEGGISIIMHAGDGTRITPNAVTMTFPEAPIAEFSYQEFHSYSVQRKLLSTIIEAAKPEVGIVTSGEFSKAIYADGPFDVGWLTYFSDPRCAPLADRFPTDNVGSAGTLFSLGSDAMFVNSSETVSIGRKLRAALRDAGVLE